MAPETHVIKKQNALRFRAARVARREAAIANRAKVAATAAANFVKYEAEYAENRAAVMKTEAEAVAAGNFYVPAEAKVALVVRIRGLNAVSPRVRKIMQLLNLRAINRAVFVKLDKSTINMLRIVEPYIAYGYPTLSTIRQLIYKRGVIKTDGNRIRIQDNTQIERVLGDKACCVEDLVHEIFTCGPNFTAVNRALGYFPLRAAIMNEKRKHFVEGGLHGNNEKYINDLVARML